MFLDTFNDDPTKSSFFRRYSSVRRKRKYVFAHIFMHKDCGELVKDNGKLSSTKF